LPVIDRIATDYADSVAFVAPAWKASLDATARRAGELLPSGIVRWGLDAEERIFSAYGVPYQPVTVVISGDGRIVDGWAGARPEEEIRAVLDRLVGR
jgi:thioredoxin-like negative regulator of GroEL